MDNDDLKQEEKPPDSTSMPQRNDHESPVLGSESANVTESPNPDGANSLPTLGTSVPFSYFSYGGAQEMPQSHSEVMSLFGRDSTTDISHSGTSQNTDRFHEPMQPKLYSYWGGDVDINRQYYTIDANHAAPDNTKISRCHVSTPENRHDNSEFATVRDNSASVLPEMGDGGNVNNRTLPTLQPSGSFSSPRSKTSPTSGRALDGKGIGVKDNFKTSSFQSYSPQNDNTRNFGSPGDKTPSALSLHPLDGKEIGVDDTFTTDAAQSSSQQEPGEQTPATIVRVSHAASGSTGPSLKRGAPQSSQPTHQNRRRKTRIPSSAYQSTSTSTPRASPQQNISEVTSPTGPTQTVHTQLVQSYSTSPQVFPVDQSTSAQTQCALLLRNLSEVASPAGPTQTALARPHQASRTAPRPPLPQDSPHQANRTSHLAVRGSPSNSSQIQSASPRQNLSEVASATSLALPMHAQPQYQGGQLVPRPYQNAYAVPPQQFNYASQAPLQPLLVLPSLQYWLPLPRRIMIRQRRRAYFRTFRTHALSDPAFQYRRGNAQPLQFRPHNTSHPQQQPQRAQQRQIQTRTDPPTNASVDHIRWQDPNEHFLPNGHLCYLCFRDLSFRSESCVSRPGAYPDICILPCGHTFHDHCLQLRTPSDQSHNPPCIICSRRRQ